MAGRAWMARRAWHGPPRAAWTTRTASVQLGFSEAAKLADNF